MFEICAYKNARKIREREGMPARDVQCAIQTLTWILVGHPAGIAITAPALNSLLFLCAGGDSWDQSLRASGLHAAIERITADPPSASAAAATSTNPNQVAAAAATTSTNPNQAASGTAATSTNPNQAPQSTRHHGASVPGSTSVLRPDQVTLPEQAAGPDQATTPSELRTGAGLDQATSGEAGGARPDVAAPGEDGRGKPAGMGVRENGAGACPDVRLVGEEPSTDCANANGSAHEVRASFKPKEKALFLFFFWWRKNSCLLRCDHDYRGGCEAATNPLRML